MWSHVSLVLPSILYQFHVFFCKETMLQIDRLVEMHRPAKWIPLSFVFRSVNTRPVTGASVGSWMSAKRLAFASVRIITMS